MEEPFDRQTMVLSAAYEGLGQLASGRTQKGLVLFGVGTVLGVLGGVTGTLLRLLTFGRLRVGPQRLNPLALVWLGVYLYNLYDAYNIASGAEDEDDLFDYEEYEPHDTAGSTEAAPGPGASASGADATATASSGTGESPAVAPPPAPPAAVSFDGASDGAPPTGGAGGISSAAGPATDLLQRTTQGEDRANTGQNVAALGDAADQLQTGGAAVGQGQTTDAPPPAAAESAAAPAPAARPTGGGSTSGTRRLALGGELDWDQGVTKAQLMEALGDDEQVRGVFGQYLPSDRVFKSEDEALNLIPTQAWQSAQGREWTGGELPPAEGPTGYLDSAAGRMPPGDHSTPES